MRYDFGGYATRNNLRCSDGRVIMKDAFKACDGKVVPLVWNHGHDSVDNVLGHALLENREDGVYVYGVFNDSEEGQGAKMRVAHGDVTALSIYANQLQQKPMNGGKAVMHGNIREVSLVLAGANPGAMIDTIAFEHADGSVEDEGIIYSGEYFEMDVDKVEHSDEKQQNTGNDEKTVQDVYDSMTEEQKTVCDYLVGLAVQQARGEDIDEPDDVDDINHSFDGGYDNMGYNVFEGAATGGEFLSHADSEELFSDIIRDAKSMNSFKDSMLMHAAEYGIDNIDVLFPDAKNVTATPEFIAREMEWVNKVMNGTKHLPYARIRSITADITTPEARAKGYITGDQKVEEVITAARRSTTPQTIYKKQKLDRDNVIDITDFDVVAWLRSEMLLMLREEIARAILIGDGRRADADDKIQEQNIRPIATDAQLYAMHYALSSAAQASYSQMVKEISLSNKDYRGSGNPTLFTTPTIHGELLWIEDKQGRRVYENDEALCAALRVKEIVEVPVMENFSYVDDDNATHAVKAIKVNLTDYATGTDKGGQISNFEDFDIDFNQMKYLIETRMSGALIRPQAAQVYEIVTPVAGGASNGE